MPVGPLDLKIPLDRRAQVLYPREIVTPPQDAFPDIVFYWRGQVGFPCEAPFESRLEISHAESMPFAGTICQAEFQLHVYVSSCPRSANGYMMRVNNVIVEWLSDPALRSCPCCSRRALHRGHDWWPRHELR
jgi:hypothetical protein